MVTYTEIKLLVDIFGLIESGIFNFLDSVNLFTSPNMSVLDVFLIGGWIFEFVWDLFFEDLT